MRTAKPEVAELQVTGDGMLGVTIRAVRKDGLQNIIHLVRDGEEVPDFKECFEPFGEHTAEPLPQTMLHPLKMLKVDGPSVLPTLKENPPQVLEAMAARTR